MSELPPATLEGWYALHQVFAIDWAGLRDLEPPDRDAVIAAGARIVTEPSGDGAGWSAAFRLAGGGADLMLVHFRETLDELADIQLDIRRSPIGPLLWLEYDYTSVTEAGLYHATAQAAEEAAPHSEEYRELLSRMAEAELASAHVRSRLFPTVPEGMRYICFYPMSKRRSHADNWYSLPVAERNRLMREHGGSGRRYSGRVFQVVTGSVGFDDWEWGVTLFARDPLEFKKIVTELRYDEASARYGEFGPFFVGIRVEPGEMQPMLAALD